MEIKDEDLEIKITATKSDKISAYAAVKIQTTEFGTITLKRFVIWKSEFVHPRFQEKINITPPRMRGRHGYLDILFFENKEQWERVEGRIYDAYHKGVIRYFGNEEKINPEDVPL